MAPFWKPQRLHAQQLTQRKKRAIPLTRRIALKLTLILGRMAPTHGLLSSARLLKGWLAGIIDADGSLLEEVSEGSAPGILPLK
jgi:hypothetical protein